MLDSERILHIQPLEDPSLTLKNTVCVCVRSAGNLSETSEQLAQRVAAAADEPRTGS